MLKVLIANRGEIATRIARACADYGVASVAVYADPDADAVHTRAADEAYALPGTRPADTYLNAEALIAIARRSGADAVHPGYGFLSESAGFARAVIEAGLTWIGPTPEAIDLLGDKVEARRIAERVGAPLVVGTPDPVSGAEEVLAFAETHGLPIVIKAAFGGGGRGLRIARRMDEVAEQFDSATREAVTAFGRGECFVERFLDNPRHIEAQVLADTFGNVVVLGTRDCSLQRRNQKLVEEAPAPFLSDAQRERIHTSARDICREAGYRGAGTVEFLLSDDGTISFLEVNTRLQVEHTVTEETCGIDLVIEQLRVADGLPLRVRETPAPRAHSIEFRINAEDPGRGYLPTPGPVTLFRAPGGPGVRVDAGVETGSVIPGSYDSLMAKLVVTAPTRAEAIARARRALAEFRIEGVASVLPFHRAVIDHADFRAEGPLPAAEYGEADPALAADAAAAGFAVHTRWIEEVFAEQIDLAPLPDPAAETALTRHVIEVDGRRVELGLPASLIGLAAGLTTAGLDAAAGSADPAAPRDGGGAPADPATLSAPITGSLVSWSVEEGEEVAAGQTVAVMEAMKMEAPVAAHRAGIISLRAEAGASVTAGAPIGAITGRE